MLKQLSIHNYVLIQDIQVDFSGRFSVFTGETGSGKSLLVKALKFITGERSSPKIIGKNDTVARVEAVFQLDNFANKAMMLQEGLMQADDDFLVICRELQMDGKNVCRINQKLVNVSYLRDIMAMLLDIHSQYDTQFLLNSQSQLIYLDRFSENESALKTYQKTYQELQTLYQRREELMSSDLNPDEIDFLKQQVQDLEALNPSVEDYEELQKTVRALDNFEKTKSTMRDVLATLNGDAGLMEQAYTVRNGLETLPEATQFKDSYHDIYYALESFMQDFSQAYHDFSFDEAEFNHLNNRLVTYNKYRRKYGSIETMIEKLQFLKTRIEDSLHYEELLIEIEKELQEVEHKAQSQAATLSQIRQASAKRLEAQMMTELHDLMLEQARFEIRFAEKPLSADGCDAITFYTSMNQGIALAPLAKVVSGGELSRLMLGLKVILSDLLGFETLVFDEIDTGVSGQVGFKIGAKMKKLSEKAQVLTISHLASVAACAHYQYRIVKTAANDETITSIQMLNDPDRVEDLAYIMSGSTHQASLETARHLLEQGQEDHG